MSGTRSYRRCSNGYLDISALLWEKGYHINECIGHKGRYGQVYLSTKISKTDRSSEKNLSSGSTQKNQFYARRVHQENEKVVIKVLTAGSSANAREVAALKQIKHHNVVRILEIFSEGGHYFIVSEYAHHGDLLGFINLRLYVNEPLARNLFRGICAGLAYLHDKNIIHRDLKCDNIVLNKYNTPIISDFGFVKEMKPYDKSATFCGSIAYTAPEILQGTPYYGIPVDIWSLGVVLYIMTHGILPFRHDCMIALAHDQLNLKFLGDVQTSDLLQDLLKRILSVEVHLRYDLSHIKRHPWFTCTDTEESGKKPSLWSKLKSAVVHHKHCNEETISLQSLVNSSQMKES